MHLTNSLRAPRGQASDKPPITSFCNAVTSTKSESWLPVSTPNLPKFGPVSGNPFHNTNELQHSLYIIKTFFNSKLHVRQLVIRTTSTLERRRQRGPFRAKGPLKALPKRRINRISANTYSPRIPESPKKIPITCLFRPSNLKTRFPSRQWPQRHAPPAE
jgi:hypothetical protein